MEVFGCCHGHTHSSFTNKNFLLFPSKSVLLAHLIKILTIKFIGLTHTKCCFSFENICNFIIKLFVSFSVILDIKIKKCKDNFKSVTLVEFLNSKGTNLLRFYKTITIIVIILCLRR